MGKLADVRAAIKTKIGAVAGITAANVHDYERFDKDIKGMREFYEVSGKINGWFIRRIRTSERSPYEGRWIVVSRWRIQGYYSLVDSNATEKTFDDLVEAIRDAFRTDETLGGIIDSTVEGNEAGIQVEDSGHVILTGVLCHSVRLALNTRYQE
ncbi:MAG: hypothetical protein FVQ79_00705 [Planctomycetes bacterium]|nr:hypothetical protein [Planctomycetota bacterium]